MSLPPTSQGAQPHHNHPAAAASPVPETEWSTGLFDCFSDLKNCFITCLCPCITFGQIAEVVDKGATSCGASGALYSLIYCLLGCGCIYSCAYRTKMRQQYKLKGTPFLDFLTHCCCETCALCQEHRELQNRGFDMVIGWEGIVERGKEAVARVPTAPAVQPMTR